MASASIAVAIDSPSAPVNEPMLATEFVQATPSAEQLLQQGLEQLARSEYEEAVATLQQVDAAALNDAQKSQLSESLTKAQSAANARKAARAAFEQGQQALAAGDPSAAYVQYRAAANNPFADAGTAAKAREQMAVAEADLKAKGMPVPADVAAPPPSGVPVDPAKQAAAREAYDAAKAAYDVGDTAGARVGFAKAIELGFLAGTFDTPPEKYLEMIERKEQLDALRAARVAIDEIRREEAAAKAAAEAEAARAVAQNNPTAPAPAGNGEAPPAPAPTPTPAPTDPVPAPVPPETTAPATPAGPDLTATAQAERLARLQRELESRKLTEQADAAAAGSSFQDALRLYDSALELDPKNERAQAGKRDVLTRLGNSPVQEPLIDQFARGVQAAKERINFLFRTNLNIAQQSIDAGEYPTAEAAIQNASVAAESNPTIFTAEELQFFRNQIAATRVTLEQSRQRAQAEALAAQQRDAQQSAAERARQQEIQRRETLAQLTRDARRYSEQGQFKEALKVVDQILAIDSRNDYATGVRPLIIDRINIDKQKRIREEWRTNVTEQMIDAEERKIPYADILRYPPNWPDLAERRDRTVEQERGGTQEDAEARAMLDRQLPDLRFDQVPFTDVIEFLRDSTQANIFVNWRALEAAAIDRNTPISTRLRNVKFSKVLRTILDDVGGGTVKLGYTIDEGVITISTLEDLAQNVDTRVYDIRDLIINVPEFTNSPDFNLGGGNGNTGGLGGGGFGGGGGGGFGGGTSGGSGLFGGNTGSGNNNDDEDEGPTRSELVEQIIQLIQDTVASDTWKDNGGTIGAIRELSGQLIVTQTPENQNAISKLLEKLRETRAIQVNIETRFLSVSRNFLEDVGVDFDFRFNYEDNPYDPLVPNPLTGLPQPIPGVNGVAPIQVNNNTANFTTASQLETGITGNLAGSFSTPNFTTSVSAFLDNFQATLLIRASQGSRNLTTVTAPRVTLFNGQRAYVFVGVQRWIVSDLEPVTGTGSSAFNPTPSALSTGVILDVQATVSSDRKYVTLTLRPQLSRLISLQVFPVTGTVNDDGGGGGGGGGGGSTTTTGFIQLPEIEITEVRTTVSVPDGGTLLLGGQTLAGEIEREAGVPMISKVPFLKRLFTNRSTAKDESVLLILVKPTIIIQKEIEEEKFPGMND
jgi:Flp pilus assembly secretin CpaC/tetratricopeptide (TPR) repeat protein